MRSIGYAAVALCLALGSCAALQSLSSTEVPYSAILVAANGVDASETTAKNYIVLCTPNPALKGCNDTVIKTKIVPAVQKARTARNAALKFVNENPYATFGPATLTDAVTTAVGALQTILTQNSIPSN
ncbi:hypothetical protein [Rhizobium rhizogenes]|uniref:hypothetical protein n=1 Tax=Rhizobium rhizogenes TaxID=359 RepID=UPI00157432DE|nr:hypothetical protein [Rhizobium rhizogenes]NTF67988.1 hypothetical protein [Rhizobium rhizogenes]